MSPETATQTTLAHDEPDGKDFFGAHPPAPSRRHEPDVSTQFLRFGNESQAHYDVPVGDRNAYVMLARPQALDQHDHVAFDHALAQLQSKLRAVFAAEPAFADQRHVEPQVRVYKPGTYANYSTGNLRPEKPQERPFYTLYFSYGHHRVELEFPSDRQDARTTQRAVNRLLEVALQEISRRIAATAPETNR